MKIGLSSIVFPLSLFYLMKTATRSLSLVSQSERLRLLQTLSICVCILLLVPILAALVLQRQRWRYESSQVKSPWQWPRYVLAFDATRRVNAPSIPVGINGDSYIFFAEFSPFANKQKKLKNDVIITPSLNRFLWNFFAINWTYVPTFPPSFIKIRPIVFEI